MAIATAIEAGNTGAGIGRSFIYIEVILTVPFTVEQNLSFYRFDSGLLPSTCYPTVVKSLGTDLSSALDIPKR